MVRSITNIRSMLVGTLLGDAHIRRTAFAAYVTFEQALAKKDYLLHLFEQIKLEGYDMNSPVQYDRTDPRYNKVNSSLYFRTVSDPSLNLLADLFLDGLGKKVVPDNIADYLDMEALAYWICDDGQAVTRGGVTLCTDSFSSHEIQVLRDALMSNFNLATTLHRKKKWDRIYIGKPGLYAIRPQLKKYVHPLHLHKIHY